MLVFRRFKGPGGHVTESIHERCEHCTEKIRDIHIAEIVTKPEHDNRVIKIRNKEGILYTIKKKEERRREIKEAAISKSLLDDYNEELKYGERAEAMCSESIDLDTGVTASFCYRVAEDPDNPKFQKIVGGRSLSASLSLVEKTDVTGSRMGVDRKGRVIKMKRYKNLDLETGRPEPDSRIKKLGPEEVSWFEALRDDDKKRVIVSTQECEGMIRRYGEEVKTMKVVARVRSLEEYADLIEANGCRL
jgi:recombinational DNA repair protein RecR